MKIKLFLLTLCLSALTLSGAELPKKIVIGKKADLQMTGANTVIVLPPKASKVTKFAAKELQTFLSQVLGKKIPVTTVPGKGVNLHLGFGKLARAKGLKGSDLARDGFFIKRYGKDIVLAGRDDPKVDPEQRIARSGAWGMFHERATVFAAYDFLERFAGVRFYFPGELGTIVPKKKSISLPAIDIVERPDFIKRWYSVYWDGEYFEGKNRKATVNPNKNLNSYRRRTNTQGGPPCTHGLDNAYNLPRRFFKSNPEYFVLTDKGERSPRHLCWNSGVTEVIYQDIKAYLTGRPASERGVGSPNSKKPHWHFAHFIGKYVDIFPGDGMIICNCAKCQKDYEFDRPRVAWATELIWNNVIKWAERLKKEKIDGVLCMAAYNPYKELPKKKIPDNVLVMVADTGPWAMGTAPGEKGMAVTRAWAAKTGRKVQLWNYAYKGYLNWVMAGIPAYTPRCVGAYYRAISPYACGAFLESESDRFLYFYMNNYIFCKVAWDNNADYEAMLDEHYKLMFGPASDVMQKIMEEFEHICTSKIVGRIIDTPLGPSASVPSDNEVWTKIYTPAKRADFVARFKKAASMVKPGSLEARRIELFRREYLGIMLKEAKRFAQLSKAARGLRFNMNESVQLTPYKFDPKRPNLVKTTVKARYTKDSLIFTIDCEEPELDNVLAPKRQRDYNNTYSDNCVEILLNPSGDRKNYFHWVVNSSGSLTDYRWRRIGKTGSRADRKWNSNAVAKSEKTASGFRITLTIPLKDIPGFKSKEFPVNFCRHRVLKHDRNYQRLYFWSPLAETLHDVENFGVMTPGCGELVLDGSFDTLKQVTPRRWGYSKSGKFHGWVAHGGKPGASLDTKVYFSAPRSMKLQSDSVKGCALTQAFTMKGLKPNTEYRVRCMLKLENVVPLRKGGGVAMNLVDARNNFLPKTQWHAGSSDWFCQDIKFKTAPKITREKGLVEVRMVYCKGTVWVDNVSVEEVKSVK